jgi:hypothetical protein
MQTKIRLHALIAALAFATPATAGTDVDYGDDSAGAYLSYCRPVAAAKVLGSDQIQFPLNAQTEKCWGAFTAIQQMIPIIEAGADTPLLRVCAPVSGMTTQLVAVFVSFGTIKARMGATQFLMKRLPRVAAEMALHVLAYNIIGIKSLIAAIRA